MTTNQTIDCVPRAQLADIADRIEHNDPNTAKELRALLDAADHVHEWDINAEGTATVCPCGARSSDEQAEQPHGEPVARVEIGADRNAALTFTDDDWLRSLKDRGVHQIVPLYAEQPAPVSVASRDESIYWLKRIDGIGQARAELIYSMGFRRHTEVPQS